MDDHEHKELSELQKVVLALGLILAFGILIVGSLVVIISSAQ